MKASAAVIERFWSKVDRTATCWLWTGSLMRRGYGRFSFNGKWVAAHRFAYELLVGQIPDGLELDHVRDRGCLHRHCVNPAHLEPVTHLVNVRRGMHPRVVLARANRCLRGHPLTGPEAKVYVNAKGNRRCVVCQNARARVNCRDTCPACGNSKEKPAKLCWDCHVAARVARASQGIRVVS